MVCSWTFMMVLSSNGIILTSSTTGMEWVIKTVLLKLLGYLQETALVSIKSLEAVASEKTMPSTFTLLLISKTGLLLEIFILKVKDLKVFTSDPK